MPEPDSDTASPSLRELRPRLPALGLVGAFVVMATFSWGTWPDPIIDFGRELYVPWRLVEGQVLYRDIAYFNGPLSPYFNALLFQLFGVSLRTLVFANLTILAGIVLLLYRLLRRFGNAFSASTACIFFLTVFAFGQLGPVANFNFVCPYSHEMTHGLALALLALALLARHLESGSIRPLAGCGFVLGMVFLTKPEISVAVLLALGTGLVGVLWQERPGLSAVLGRVTAVALPAALPGLLAFALLARAMPASEAWFGTLGGWAHLANRSVTDLAYYQAVLGLDDPAKNLGQIAMVLAVYIASLGTPLLFMRSASPLAKATMALGPPLILWLAVRALDLSPYYVLLPLPVAIAVASGYCGWQVWSGERPAIWRLSFLAFASGLLLKIALHVGVAHYGFVLSVPATLITIVALLDWIPRRLDDQPSGGTPYRIGVLLVLILGIAVHLQSYASAFESKRFAFGSGPDEFKADARARIAGEFLARLEEEMEPGDDLVALPEGVMLNYLSRRPNPTRFIVFVPPEVAMFGERTILAELKANPPDFIALVQRSTAEYGLPIFGIHYGTSIMRWVRERYEFSGLVGARPLVPERLNDHRWGIQLMKRKPAPAAKAEESLDRSPRAAERGAA